MVADKDTPGARMWAAAWAEYDSAAEWCARRGSKGNEGDPLPDGLSALCATFINEDIEAFADRVRLSAYARAMAHVPEYD